ncbi:MAG: hypothetical protein D6775_11585 [Caldilineae bacterium]|nr:MAG: hypothetical protein D6775_11585 [Caldilineae bacterium]
MRRFGLCLLLLLALSACTVPQVATPTPPPTPATDELLVDASRDLGTISPYVFGANHGPWAVVSADLMDEAQTAGITFLRFPGGNWGDENDLRPYHIDGFLALARQLGAEPQISVRLRGGTPEQAAELVRYANIEKGYGIRYWSIGNEPGLYHSKPGFEGYDTARLNREWRAIAQAMRQVDPDILLLGPEVTQYTGHPESDPKDAAGKDWVRTFLEANGDLVDIVSIHRYPFPKSMTAGTASPAELLANPAEWDHIIPTLRELIRLTTGRELPIAITEINSYWTNVSGGETTPDSFLSALWWADTLGHLISQDVQIVAFFSLQSNPSIGGYGLLARRDVRPGYYVYRLYSHFGRQQVAAASGDPAISLYAARRDDGALTVLAINRSDRSRSPRLKIVGFDPAPAVQAWLFDAEHPVEALPPLDGPPETVTLPPYSATLLIFSSDS